MATSNKKIDAINLVLGIIAIISGILIIIFKNTYLS